MVTLSPLKRGFTLLEMLCVMTISVLLLSLALASSVDWGRAAAIDASTDNLLSSMAMARQWAIANNKQATISIYNTPSPQRGYYALSSPALGTIGNTNYLADGVLFTTSSVGHITFRYDGSCLQDDTTWNNNSRHIVLSESAVPSSSLTVTITVHSATAYAQRND